MEEPIKYFDYRGYHVPIYMDEPGQQFYCVLEGEEVGFGAYNTNYEDDLMYLIDKRLDHICSFEDYHGSELTWFFNGYNNRDICLKYRSRILKVFLVTDEEKVSETEINTIKEECLKILQKVKKN